MHKMLPSQVSELLYYCWRIFIPADCSCSLKYDHRHGNPGSTFRWDVLLLNYSVTYFVKNRLLSYLLIYVCHVV